MKLYRIDVCPYFTKIQKNFRKRISMKIHNHMYMFFGYMSKFEWICTMFIFFFSWNEFSQIFDLKENVATKKNLLGSKYLLICQIFEDLFCK